MRGQHLHLQGTWDRWGWEYPPSIPELFKAVAAGGWVGIFKGLWRVAAGGGLQGLLPAGKDSTAFVEQIPAVVYVPVILQRQVPAVQVVHVLECAPHSVHRQSADLLVVQQRRENRLDFTGAVLEEVVVPVVVQRQCLGRDSAENCGTSAVRAHRQGSTFP